MGRPHPHRLPPRPLTEILLCQGCFPGNSPLYQSPKHTKFIWPRHSQNIIGEPEFRPKIHPAKVAENVSFCWYEELRLENYRFDTNKTCLVCQYVYHRTSFIYWKLRVSINRRATEGTYKQNIKNTRNLSWP